MHLFNEWSVAASHKREITQPMIVATFETKNVFVTFRTNTSDLALPLDCHSHVEITLSGFINQKKRDS